MILTGLLLYSRSMISMLFLGRLGDLPLAGGSLAIGFANITGYSILSGLSSGMEPICGQSYGAKRYKLLSLTLHRTILLLLLISIPISFLWLNIKPILVGNELGANNPTRAKLAALVGMSWSFVLGVLAMLFAVMVRNVWAAMFTADVEILALTSMVLPIIGVCELGNCPQTTGCGVLRGSARPKLGANINLGCFYLVGMPVAMLLSFYLGYDFRGLWLGLMAAQGSCLVTMLFVVSRTDWKVEAARANQLTSEEEDHVDDVTTLFNEVESDSKPLSV
ncbi:Protein DETOXIFICATION 49 [Linum grandiflorum]